MFLHARQPRRTQLWGDGGDRINRRKQPNEDTVLQCVSFPPEPALIMHCGLARLCLSASDYGYERRGDGNCRPAFWFNPYTLSKSCSQGQNYFNSTGWVVSARRWVLCSEWDARNTIRSRYIFGNWWIKYAWRIAAVMQSRRHDLKLELMCDIAWYQLHIYKALIAIM